MISKQMESGLNQQVKREMEAAYLYLSMAAYCEAEDYPGFAKWLEAQAQEELGHAMKFFRHIQDRGATVKLHALAEPESDFASVTDVFEQVLAHERKITASIHELYGLAMQEKDFASMPLLQEFIAEQIEEEKAASDLLARLKKAWTEGHAVLLVDQELSERG